MLGVFLILFLWQLGVNGRTTTRTSTTTKSTCKPGQQGTNCDECGLVYYNEDLKIVGGEAATAHSWPAEAWVQFVVNQTVTVKTKRNRHETFDVAYQVSCGGTLIDRDTVLSAGHCVMDSIDFEDDEGNSYSVPLSAQQAASMYNIYLGFQDISTQDGTIVGVSKVIQHPEFSSETLLNDLSIFKLNTSVELSKTIQIACLPLSAGFPNKFNVTTYASGWGLESENAQNIPSILQNVKLTIYTGPTCNNVDQYPDWNKQICAGDLAGGKDTCSGDSGSAIYYNSTINNTAKFIAVGITSYGNGCALKGYAGVYTNISSYLPWIYEQM